MIKKDDPCRVRNEHTEAQFRSVSFWARGPQQVYHRQAAGLWPQERKKISKCCKVVWNFCGAGVRVALSRSAVLHKNDTCADDMGGDCGVDWSAIC